MSKAIFTYTTSIEPQKTIAEIQDELSQHGAKQILIDYDKESKISGLSFSIETPQGIRGIRLPCNWEAVYKILEKKAENREIPQRFVDKHHALRVAWRVIFYWVKSQMAILETEQVKLEEIFLPYMVTKSGETVYQKLVNASFELPELPDKRKK